MLSVCAYGNDDGIAPVSHQTNSEIALGHFPLRVSFKIGQPSNVVLHDRTVNPPCTYCKTITTVDNNRASGF